MTYDKHSGIIKGPFKDCACESHHQHGENGALGCPICTPKPIKNENCSDHRIDNYEGD